MCPDGQCGGKKPGNGLGYDRSGPHPSSPAPAAKAIAPTARGGCNFDTYAGRNSCAGSATTASTNTYAQCPGCGPGMTREKFQLLLDVIGLIPVLGEAADVANCGVHARYGELLDAGMSCSSAIPLLGIAAGLAKIAKNGKKLEETSDAGKAAVKCANSFTGDTRVLMADGSTKRIDQIKVGDNIANSEPESQETEQHGVVAVHVTDADKDYVDLVIATPRGDRTIRTTADHPFCNATAREWVDAAELGVGQQLNTPGNGRATIRSACRYNVNLRTYNLTIDAVHTYYVVAGTTSILVHNDGDLDLNGKSHLVWQNGPYRIDIEGAPSGVQMHFQVQINGVKSSKAPKYHFNPQTGEFDGMPKSLKKELAKKYPDFEKAVAKGVEVFKRAGGCG
ncbi:hypothetical protein BN6_21060 [Saccharothrix espanaensis DSM 44229]|uniref:Hint domain-containing protein n=2 Tax=Saccharothrix espanaensis TaxID=103731 RepID=K0JYU9_SACES|nr:hypothetical protein BN6_21060 [Saccharothrix espanaensis DSM 44229]